MHSYRNDCLPPSFNGYFKYTKDLGANRLRDQDGNFFIPEQTSTRKSQHMEAAMAWNKIPYGIKNTSKHILFKKRIKILST